MKRFDFSLERVRKWRESVAEMEEARLAALHAEMRSIGARRAALDDRRRQAESLLVERTVANAEDLRALDDFHGWARSERGKLDRAEADLRERIDRQRQAVMEARRRFRLLDLMKERAQGKWNAELAGELEALAAEAYLAQWGRRK